LKKLIKINQAGGNQKGRIKEEVRRAQDAMEVRGHKEYQESEEQQAVGNDDPSPFPGGDVM
jgi:hypothetical protein